MADKYGTWISVKERMPEEEKKYLVCKENGAMICADWSNCLENVDESEFKGDERPGFYGYDYEWGYYTEPGVVAWTPLPEPYKVGYAE